MELALTCRNAHAKEMMRLLAADLMVTADEQRQPHAADLDEAFAELIRNRRPTAEAKSEAE